MAKRPAQTGEGRYEGEKEKNECKEKEGGVEERWTYSSSAWRDVRI